jgi:hypothetical protein
MLKLDIEQIRDEGGLDMVFHPYQKDGPLLILDKDGHLPAKYAYKFFAYQLWARDYGGRITLDTERKGKELIYHIRFRVSSD